MLLRRLILAGLALALLFAWAASWGVERIRHRDRELAIERMASTQTTDLVRARCEANPNWFLAGPREASPSQALLAQPDADVFAPRPDTDPRSIEFFAYDIEYIGQSTAAPRLPQPIRSALRAGAYSVTTPFETPEGTGVQTAVATNWSGPCAVLLFRMHPPPGQFMEQVRIFGLLAFGAFAVVLLVVWPLDWRIRSLGARMRASARTEYMEPALVGGRDELSSLGFAYNEAAVVVRRLQADVRDREADFRRFVSHVSSEVDEPLRPVLASGDVVQATALALHLSNLVIGARFRETGAWVRNAVDVSAQAQMVAREFGPAASTKGVEIDLTHLDSGVLEGDPSFMIQALRNLIANALLRETPGGRVSIAVRGAADGTFFLRVSDTGPDLDDDELRQLNAIRRFRGDEGRGAELRGDIGLGLAVVHEVCHRFALQLSFRRRPTGGLEVELAQPLET